jgi:DNA-binding protein HU-beta
VTRATLYNLIASRTGLKPAQVRDVIEAARGLLEDGLRKDGRVTLGDIGTAKLVHRAARLGRNPMTGEKLNIPAKTVVKFVPSAGLKRAFDKTTS